MIHAGNSSNDEDAAQEEVTFIGKITGNLTDLTFDVVF